MRYYRQVVAEALSADPPQVRGLLEGDMLRRLVCVRGSGRDRVFEFDIAGEKTYRWLVRRAEKVALIMPPTAERMVIRWLTPTAAVTCPHCGFDMLGVEFWEHYDLFHSRRPGWLNKEDWSRMGLPGDFQPPPEQR